MAAINGRRVGTAAAISDSDADDLASSSSAAASHHIALITASHEHLDHVGGIAAFERVSNAAVATSARGADALRTGKPTPADPHSGMTGNAFPSVRNLRVVADGEVLRVGSVELTAHATPGHTPGSMSWSWRSCEGDRCLNVVYADSLNPVSRDGFRFSGDATRPSIVEEFRRTIAKVESLPCDIILSVHPGFAGMSRKLKLREAGGPNPFIAPKGCRAYAADARSRLEARIAQEKKQ